MHRETIKSLATYS